MSSKQGRLSLRRPEFKVPKLDEQLMSEIEAESDFAQLRHMSRVLLKHEDEHTSHNARRTSYSAELGMESLKEHQLFPLAESPSIKRMPSSGKSKRSRKGIYVNEPDGTANTSNSTNNTNLSDDENTSDTEHDTNEKPAYVRYDSVGMDMFRLSKNSLRNMYQNESEHLQYHVLFNFSLRKWIRKHFLRSRGGQVLDYTNAVISITSCVIYIMETYFEYCEWFYSVRVFDLMLCVVFIADYLLRFILADSRLRYITTTFAIIDLLTIAPVYYTLQTVMVHENKVRPEFCPPVQNETEWDEYIAEYSENSVESLLRVMRTLRIFRVQRVFIYMDSEISRKVGVLVLNLVAMCLFTTGLMLWSESKSDHEFHDLFYFIIVTLSTVGYGDISPDTPSGKAITALFILFALFYIPKATNSILKLISMRSRYTTVRYKPSPMMKHVLMCGNIDPGVVRDFCKELFHLDHGDVGINVVILNKGPPSNELEHVLNSPQFSVSTFYLDGSPFFAKDLERAHAQTASACFIFVDKWSEEADAADAEAILMALTVKRFATQHSSHDIMVCIQLMKPESKVHYFVSRAKVFRNHPDQMVVVNELKMNLLAKSCLVPGLTTMLGNLITSSEKNLLHVNEPPEWFMEFEDGCQYEIYRIKLTSCASGVQFCDLAMLCYRMLNITIIALEVGTKSSPPRIMLNPGCFIIPDSTKYILHVFVVSQDRASASIISSELGEFSEHLNSHSALSIRSKKSSRRVAPQPSPREDSTNTTLGSPTHKTSRRDARRSVEQETKRNPDVSEGQFRYKVEMEFENALRKLRLKSALYDIKKGETLDNIEETGIRLAIPLNPYAPHILQKTKPQELSKVTIQTSLREELPFVREHIIVTGNLENLLPFVQTLRTHNMGRSQPILLLHTEPPSFSTWQHICEFPQVLYMFGSALQEEDLIRAGVKYASCAVVLSKTYSKAVQSDEDHSSCGTPAKKSSWNHGQSLADADATFAHQSIMKLNPQIKIVTEITNQENVGFLDTEEEAMLRFETSRQVHQQFSVQYQAGRVFAASMLDTLLCQSFYNPQITTVIKLLVLGPNPMQVVRWTKCHKSLPPIYESQLYQIPVPKAYTNKSFGELFIHLSEMHSIIPIAVLRGVWPKFGHGGTGAVTPYVYTNPKFEAQLYSCDSVFILSQAPPTKDFERQYQEVESGLAATAQGVADVAEQLKKHIAQTQTQKPRMPTDYHLTCTYLDERADEAERHNIESLARGESQSEGVTEPNAILMQELQAMSLLHETCLTAASSLETMIRLKKQEIIVEGTLSEVLGDDESIAKSKGKVLNKGHS